MKFDSFQLHQLGIPLKFGKYIQRPYNSLHYFDNWISELFYKGLWEACRMGMGWGFFGESNGAIASILAAIGDSWGAYTYPGIRDIGRGGMGERQWQGFYILLYHALHPGVTVLDGEIDLIRNQLNIAPDEGPYYYATGVHPYYDPFDGGWSSTYKWRKTIDAQNNGQDEWKGNYNGLDYMLAYNLYLIAGLCTTAPWISDKAYHQKENIIVDHLIPYHHIAKGIFVDDLKYMVNSEIILTGQVLKNMRYDENYNPLPVPIDLPGRLSLLAGKQIVLRPGFYAEKGSSVTIKLRKIHNFSGDFSLYNDGYDESTEFIPSENLNNPCVLDKSPITNGILIDSTLKASNNTRLFDSNKIEIYPNPVHDLLSIDLKNKKIDYISVLNIYGDEVLRNYPAEKVKSINISKLPSAMYIIYLFNDANKYVFKIIKN